MKYAKKAGYIAALILFLIFTAGPFVWTFIISITPDHAMFAPTPELLPGEVTFENYKELFSGGQRGSRFFESMYNSLRAVAITLCIGVPVAVMSAYALSRMEFKGRKVIKNLLLITMVIPVMATIIPLYQMFAAGKMLDDIFWLSMVYVSSYLPMAVWLISNYFATIPEELEEAALIDGCGKFVSFFRIILPLSYPIILSVILIMFLNTWSQFQIPLILASSMETKPMAIVVSEFMTKDTIQYGLIAAAGMLALIPPALTALIFPDATESIGQNAFADCYNLRSVSFGRGMKEIGTYSFTGYDWTGTGQGGCPLLGEIICRATTPPTLEESYGSGPFGGSYEIIAGSKAETRVIHLPESDDPSLSTGGGYVNSGWVQLTMAPYNFTFVYDVEPTGTWK